VTAFFAAAPKVAAIALLVRVLAGPFAELAAQWQVERRFEPAMARSQAAERMAAWACAVAQAAPAGQQAPD
jgi:glycerol kinase